MALAEQTPETRLLQFFTTTLEPRQVEWLKRKGEDIKSVISGIVTENYTEALEGKTLEEIAQSESGHPRVLGSKLIAFTLDPKTVMGINKISTNGRLNSEEAKLVIRYVLRQVYLATHPDESEVQKEPPFPKTIFKDPSQIKTTEYTSWQPRRKPAWIAIDSAKSTITTRQRDHAQRSTWEPTSVDESALAAYGSLTREQIIFARKWLELSQEGLAKIVGVSRGIITDTENGRRGGEQTFRRISAGIWRHLKKQITPETQKNPINELLEIFKERGI